MLAGAVGDGGGNIMRFYVTKCPGFSGIMDLRSG